MPIIYTYPSVVPKISDLVLLSTTNSDDENVTANASIASIKDVIDVVDTFTSSFGTYISGTTNASATGNVNIGSLDLSAVDGTAVIATRFLSKDNTWDVPDFAGSFSTIGLADNSSINYTVKLPNLVGTANQVLKLPSTIGSSPYQLTWGDASGGGVPGGSTGSVQFKNSSSGFAGDSALTFSAANKTLTIGDTTQDTAGIIEIQSDENGGVLKIGGGSQAYYTSIKGSDSDTANYNIILPPAGPGGNNKILESTSAGILSWIDTPSGTSYSAGDGLDLTGTTFSTDLKANGGLVIQSTELAVDLSASAITGTLSESDGGTGASLSATVNNTLIGNGDYFAESGDVETGILLPVGATNRRPTANSTNVGLMRYNSQTANFEVCKQTTSSSGQYSWYTINVTIITE